MSAGLLDRERRLASPANRRCDRAPLWSLAGRAGWTTSRRTPLTPRDPGLRALEAARGAGATRRLTFTPLAPLLSSSPARSAPLALWVFLPIRRSIGSEAAPSKPLGDFKRAQCRLRAGARVDSLSRRPSWRVADSPRSRSALGGARLRRRRAASSGALECGACGRRPTAGRPAA